MSSYTKMIIIIAIAIILSITFNISTLLILNNSTNHAKQNCLQEKGINEKINEEELEVIDIKNSTQDENFNNIKVASNTKEEKTETNDKFIGTVHIPKINFKGKIYEGTSLEVLAKGVGHFDNSPYQDGNVCLAAHNTSKFWAELNRLEIRR